MSGNLKKYDFSLKSQDCSHWTPVCGAWPISRLCQCHGTCHRDENHQCLLVFIESCTTSLSKVSHWALTLKVKNAECTKLQTNCENFDDHDSATHCTVTLSDIALNPHTSIARSWQILVQRQDPRDSRQLLRLSLSAASSARRSS